MCFLFYEKDRRPSTIEGYRTAIADTLGNTPLDISNNTEIARLIASFHRDKPKASRSILSWDLSLVLHQLKQPPFEPLEEVSLKCATWKTVFLLALASGKRHSEIHAWTMDGLLCLGDWDQIQLTPSPSFIPKNQLAREGTQAVSPVVIPALKTSQDDRDKDILLCPVRALSIYLKLSADSRHNKTLLLSHTSRATPRLSNALLYRLGLKILSNFVIQEWAPTWTYWGLRPMTSEHLLLPKPFRGVSQQTRFSKPAIGNLITHSRLSISRTSDLWSEPKRPLLPLRILCGCTTGDGSSLAPYGRLEEEGGLHDDTSSRWGQSEP